MGLDTSHNAWHGPYSAFNRFRRNLMLSYNNTSLDDYEGYGGNIPMNNIADKGLFIFFNHSDCDGDISPEDCKLVSESLLSLSPKVTDNYYRDLLTDFANGCALAYNNNETLEFS
jgi:hypothetical protein